MMMMAEKANDTGQFTLKFRGASLGIEHVVWLAFAPLLLQQTSKLRR
jgi:hypothetical protein